MGELVQSTQFTVGEWAVEPNLGRIRRNGQSTILEPRIMELLVYLADHAGETVSTDELAENVWAGRAVTDQPVYQGIAQLRKALDDEARHPRFIATVTRIGYRLIAPVEMPESEVAPTEIQRRSERQPRFLLPVFSLILAGSYLFLSSSDVSVSRERGTLTPSEFGSIAVLPFVDMSEDRSQQYLGDGIAEELIHRIAAIPNVRVVARSSSFSFRDSQADVQSIGERLGADVILEGSVRRSGDRLRITAQLVDVTDGYHIWSQSYEPVFDDAFAVQDQIAISVAQLLQTGGNVDLLPTRSWTQNANAVEAYYIGMFQMHKRRAQSLDKALEYFQKAVTHDPQFALAYTGLAQAYFLASDERFGNLPDGDALQKSSAALRMAQMLDDSLVEIYGLLASEAIDERNYVQAEAHILRGIEINPSYAPTYKHYGFLLRLTGRQNEALVAKQKAVALDPLSPVFRVNLGASYGSFNRLAEAEAQFLIAIELDSDWHVPYFFLANLVARNGQLVRAIELARTAMTVEGPHARFAGQAAMGIGNAYLTLGDFLAASQWFGQGEDMGVGGWYLANHHVHLLLAQNRIDETDTLLSHWAIEKPNLENVFSLGGLYRAMIGQDAAAINMFEIALSLPAEGSASNLFVGEFLYWGYVPAVHLARLYFLTGETDEAEQLLEQSDQYLASVEQESPGLPGENYVRASIHAVRGNNRDALASLQLAIEGGWSKLWFVERDPIFAAYHGDPNFESIMEKLRARLAAQRQKLVQLAEANIAP